MKDGAGGYINKSVSRIKAMFRWAKNEQLIAPSVYEGIRDISALKAGRTNARESNPVKPVPRNAVNHSFWSRCVSQCCGTTYSGMEGALNGVSCGPVRYC